MTSVLGISQRIQGCSGQKPALRAFSGHGFEELAADAGGTAELAAVHDDWEAEPRDAAGPERHAQSAHREHAARPHTLGPPGPRV